MCYVVHVPHKTGGQWLPFSRTLQCMHSFFTPKFFDNKFTIFFRRGHSFDRRLPKTTHILRVCDR